MTISADLDDIVGETYSSTQKTNAITLATKYASAKLGSTVSDGDSDSSDLAVAMFAAAILKNQEQIALNQLDPTVPSLMLTELWTDDMQRMLMRTHREKRIRTKSTKPSNFSNYASNGWLDSV